MMGGSCYSTKSLAKAWTIERKEKGEREKGGEEADRNGEWKRKRKEEERDGRDRE